MENFICTRCGTQYAAIPAPPAACTICTDEREAVREGGQQWTTLGAMQAAYRNTFMPLDPGITGIVTEPQFAIGQQAHLIQTDHGNVLWDCVSLVDDATVTQVQALGGLAAIAVSHPHLYGSMVEWSHAFDDAPIYVHAADRGQVRRPAEAIRYWEEEAQEILPSLTLVRCGGHFPGSAVLHWAGGAEGRGALFTGDTIMVADDRRWVSFMYSYVNAIPLSAAAVRGIAAAVAPYRFDRLYGGWWGLVVSRDARGAVLRSAERYIRHLEGSAGPHSWYNVGE
jgi:glyoxylase-like metal-dependent hydrolase (beta-lactamase superfamily II)